MKSYRSHALVAGLFYYITHVTSVAAVIVYGSSLTEPGESHLTAADNQILGGAMLEFALAIACVGTGIAVLPVLKRFSTALAHSFLGLRIVEAAVIVVGIMPMLALLWLRQEITAGGTVENFEGFAQVLVFLHDASFRLGQGFVIAVNTLVIGYLIWKSGIVPKWIGMLGLVGGALVLIGNVGIVYGWLVEEELGLLAFIFVVPVFAFEIIFASWMVFAGFRSSALTQSTAIKDPEESVEITQ